MRTPKVTSFTEAAVQRAMDEKAAKWGAPAGYYSVDTRALVVDRYRQIWRVKVRLFGGTVLHFEDIVFAKQGYEQDGKIIYHTLAEHIMTPQLAEKMFHIDARYPQTSRQAYAKWGHK
ncbi:hypothetical protein SALGADO_12 [Arthrobacter phage Salgado]|uniref:Uncharacterized protein n=3 Tax=Laroyevirus TaxID=1982086 RepID=A0A0U4JJP6_9CAUD|nr:hypothetical protein FDH64_gp12 [Arthrobacter phage Laroye]YP_010082525.1 hypothetical protein KMD21_gp12 [Arthrobacter phage LiSara]YP_010082621.1 hypothetical protein KMD22_gp12 [Arthrobacter phage Salgado]ALY09539.1 hypothetical protein LAROYE_12 [Arthrobacter phage Laroye]ALY10180.1 hypothetical protein SALGADO_12 [Arthrobacter phage Salgado]ASR83596.1 hypothetical protein SEA_LISARA_12 [Arthrobacter phage LiSara]